MYLFENESQKGKKKCQIIHFHKNLSCNFSTETVHCSGTLTQKRQKVKQRFVHMKDQKEPVCASSFAKNGHEPLYLDLQFRGGGSSCKFGGDDEKNIQFYCTFCRIFLHFCWSAVQILVGTEASPTVIIRSAAPAHGHHWLSQKQL